MIIYFCSPFAGAGETEADRASDRARNEGFAIASCKDIALAGEVTVFAPHLHFPRFLDDADERERNRGIMSGLEIMHLSDEVWFRLPIWRTEFSRGMRYELANADAFGKVVVNIRDDAQWIAALARLR